MALRIVRGTAFLLMVSVALLLVLQQQGVASDKVGYGLAINYWVPLSIAVAFFIAVLAIDVLTPNKRISAISGVFLGTLTGILATVALSFLIDLVIRTWLIDQREVEALKPILASVKVLLGVALCYLCISTVIQTQDQFRLVLPYVEFSKQIRGVRPNLLDTSALIDARIADVAATTLLQAPYIIPAFVIDELQTLADSSDRLKRQRGRRGLDVIARLQRQGFLDLSIDESASTAMSVDQALIELAERLSARIVTTDMGLARVASIRGIETINLHDVSAAFRPSLLPGEPLTLRLLKPGEQPGQAVGYLEDGTMVVVDHAATMLGQSITVLVTSTLQTAGGRLVFAKPERADANDESHPIVAESTGMPELASSAQADTSSADADDHAEAANETTPSTGAASTAPSGPSAPGASNSASAISRSPAGPLNKGGPRRPPSMRNPRRG